MVYDFPVVQSVRANIEIWLSHGTSWPLNLTAPFSVSNSDGFFYPITVYIESDEALTMPVVAVYLEAQLNHNVPHLPNLQDAQVISDHFFNINLLRSIYRSDAPLKAFVDPCLGVCTIMGMLVDGILCLPVNAIRSPDVGRI